MAKAAKRRSVANKDPIPVPDHEMRDDLLGDDAGLIHRLHMYNLNRARFELALAETGFGSPPIEEQSSASEARRIEALREMEAHIELLETEVQQRVPRTVLGCAELLRTAEAIHASQERSPYGPCSKGNVRKLLLAAIEGLDQTKEDMIFDDPSVDDEPFPSDALESASKITPSTVAVDLSRLTIADLQVIFEATRAGHLTVTSFENEPRCKEEAAGIISEIGTVLGAIIDAVFHHMETMEPTNDGDALKRAAVLTQWTFQDCSTPAQVMEVLAERFGTRQS